MNLDQDYELTLAALTKILNAMKRGTLSSRISITRHPTQIVLSNTSEDDQAWVAKHFPGQLEDHSGYVRRLGSQRFEEHRYVAYLRDRDPDLGGDHSVPRIEIWNIRMPHVCREFVGRVSLQTGPFWRCASHNCNKRIIKTKARQLGLLP